MRGKWRVGPMMPTRWKTTANRVASGVGVAILALVLLPCRIFAQAPGDTVVFLVPAGTSITSGATGDQVIVIGKSAAGTDASPDCVTDTALRPTQTVVAVDPGAGDRATRIQGAIILSTNGMAQTESLPNGTKLKNLTSPDQCLIGEIRYDRYTATVD